ncbi:hypothetical protein CANMA_002471 [Candida margitis]|uniref:uncharacterized protein n=1 Tax=Candida margitis TaxID=1775924 RepID=UPI0022262708|nr:uncharacterized protein CANMA_002471 [Candida margitis]KAI5968255.1 hypothetical protein CANMA_002471 [Candida margitis]
MDLNQETDQLTSDFYTDFTTKPNVDSNQKVDGFAEDFVITPDSGNLNQTFAAQNYRPTDDDYAQLYSQYGKPPINISTEGIQQDNLGDNTLSEFQLNDINFDFILKSGQQQQQQQQPQQSQQQLQQQENLLSNNVNNPQLFVSDQVPNPSQQQAQQYYQLQNQQDDFEISGNSKAGTSSMPGAFLHQEDNMEVDESPPFTIESDLYFDQGPDNNSIITSNNLQPHHDNRSSIISHSNHAGYHSNHLKSPMQNNDFNTSPFDDTSRVSSYQNMQYMVNNNLDGPQGINRRSYVDNESQKIMGRLRNGSIDSYYAANVINQHLHPQQQLPQQPPTSQQQLQYQQHANAQYSTPAHHDMSPLTTTTSNTHSISSLHSAQPSFFSAQQFFSRNSLDQQQSLLNRPSSDIYGRPSMDSQQSQQQQQRNPRYSSFTNSISNMIPFMGDRSQSQRSPSGNSIQPSLNGEPTANQSRHLIRSIFKSNSALNSTQNPLADDTDIRVENSDDVNMDEISNQFLTTPADSANLIINPELEAEVEQPKKAKTSKRSLFTRFKSSKQDDGDDTPKVGEKEPLLQENESLETANVGSGQASSGTPSFMTGGAINLENSTSESSQTVAEPDYAALFENMGKRKPIGSSYRKPKREKSKDDQPQAQQNSNNNVTTSSLFFGKNNQKGRGTSSNNSIMDNASATNISVSSSNASSSLVAQSMVLNENDDQTVTSTSTPPPPTSSLANASKRILGSKIMSKNSRKSSSKVTKKEKDKDKDRDIIPPDEEPIIASLDTPVATMISKGVEVDVDLASLDLPPDTKIFPTSIINSKNRTRGRKENKEADLNDESKIYLCNYCSRRFKRHEHLKRHFRSLHTFEKPFDCPKCNKKFSRSDNLQQHLKIHNTGEDNEGGTAIEEEENGGDGVV